MMVRNATDDGTELTGNDQFYGFNKDLLDLVSNYLGIRYELRLVADGKHGQLEEGGWNGVVGEMVRKVSDDSDW